MTQVKCSVSNCSYWESGNRCAADMIMIEIDQHASAKFQEEFASEYGDSNHQDKVLSAQSTCCQTFQRAHDRGQS